MTGLLEVRTPLRPYSSGVLNSMERQETNQAETETLRIGQLAAPSSVGVETLRFYEREGLIECQ